MNVSLLRKLLLAFLLLVCHTAFSQYILNGSAQKVSCNCYTLTEERNTQSGSVWNSNKISLNNSFDFWFNVFLGCADGNGADGIVFILQPISTSVGSSGAGMGFGGVAPSIGIALDTWQNPDLDDPPFDHISIQSNGNTHHSGDLAGPVAVSATSNNIEDCQWHILRITWDAPTKTLIAFFDGEKRVEKQVDLVATIFGNDPNVFWGFTGATGGAVNLQQFCTALNPIVSTSSSANNGCEGVPIQFIDASESFAPIVNYTWSFGDGTTSTNRNPPPHVYANAGTYPVNLKIIGQDGCENDSTFMVTIGSVPNVALDVTDTCFGNAPGIQLQENNVAVSYHWSLDGVPFSGDQVPQLPPLSAGTHRLQVVVSSDFSCGPPAEATKAFVIKPLPEITAQVDDGCTDETIFFNGLQVDNNTTISQWQWNFSDGNRASSQTTTRSFNTPGRHPVSLSALATNGCMSIPVDTSVIINQAIVFAGNDTAVIKGLPFQLQGHGNGSFVWSPASNLTDPTIANPIATLEADQQFVLSVTTAEGCLATDTVIVKTFNGPAVYVPSAFTPNGDGKNDQLKPVYVGIKELRQFAIFNRWGQQVFATKEMGKGWNGRGAAIDTYVWFIQAIDGTNRPMQLKGTVTIIR